jgi:cytochrome P450
MTLFPDVQSKAQDEINRVIGNDRLPNLADHNSLPYVSALVSEVMRWRPVGPIGLF